MLDPADVYESLSEGRTIAELLEAQGVTLEDILAALRAPHDEDGQQADDDASGIHEQVDEDGKGSNR